MIQIQAVKMPETDCPTMAIPVWPKITAALTSPTSGLPVSATGIMIPGSRVLAWFVNENEPWMMDLPVGAAIKAPSALSPKSGAVVAQHGHTMWYADQLREAYRDRESSAEISPTASVRRECRDIVIVNCIDHLYGHCLLKLLNCDYHQNSNPDVGICVLIQPQLRDLVPDYVAEVWEVDIPLRDGVQWFDSVNRWIQQRLPQYATASISRAYSHLSSRHYDIENFARRRISDDAVVSDKTPIVHFSCRPDRCWGKNASMQQRRLQNLYFQLRRRYEKLAFVVSGFGEPKILPDDNFHEGWIDLRTNHLTKDIEDHWLSTMSVADIAVGVHGSNMLLPTAFVGSAVIMLPLHKYDGIGLDVLTPNLKSELPFDPREEILKYAFVYGDEELTDVSPRLLARIICNKLGYSRINAEWFRFGPDYNCTQKLHSMLSEQERVAAVHRVERMTALGKMKRALHRLCIRMAANFE